jgi:hypothetical protein
MRHVVVSFAGLFAAIIVQTGCQSSPRGGSVSRNAPGDASTSSSFDVTMAAMSESDFAQRHQFYYYANAQVYRDCDEDRWIWSKDGGATWHSGSRLPLSIGLGDEIPFAVTLDVNDPASQHPMIATAYPPSDESMAASAARTRAETDEP